MRRKFSVLTSSCLLAACILQPSWSQADAMVRHLPLSSDCGSPHFSSDGKTLSAAVSSDEYHIVREWDTATGKFREGASYHLGDNSTRASILSPDGQWLAEVAQRKEGDKLRNDLRLWKAKPLALQQTLWTLAWTLSLYDGPMGSVVFSPDSQILAAMGWTPHEGSYIRLWSVETKQLKHSLKVDGETAGAALFSLDSRTLLLRYAETLRVCDVRTGTLRKLSARPDYSAALSPDGTKMAIGTTTYKQVRDGSVSGWGSVFVDGKVEIWDVKNDRLERTLPGHAAKVSAVAFSPDGSTLASAEQPDAYGIREPAKRVAVRLWDVATGKLTKVLRNSGSGAASVVFSPDGRLIAFNSFGVLSLWDTSKTLNTTQGEAK